MLLTTIQAPSGKFIYCGSIPERIAFFTNRPDLIETALQCGPRIAKLCLGAGDVFESSSFDSAAEAIAFAARNGYVCHVPTKR